MKIIVDMVNDQNNYYIILNHRLTATVESIVN